MTELSFHSVGYGSESAATLIAAMLAEAHRRYGPEPFPAADPTHFLPPHGEFLLVLNGAVPVGCGGFARVEEGLGELRTMFVDPAWRRQGIGRALLRELEERAWASGYGTARLHTGLRQPEAIALYRSVGYRDIPRYPPHVDDELAVCMAKELRPFAAADGVA